MKTFQKPLTKQEEESFLHRWEQGDREARDILIERNMRLVAHVAKKYADGERDMEDLISIGTIGLIKAVNTFSVKKGNKLGTYAAKCIDNEILMMLRMQKKYSRDVSLFEPIGTDKEGNVISLVDVIESEEEETWEKVSREEEIGKMIRALLRVLSEKEQRILVLRYGLNGEKEYTQREIAQKMGISRSYVSRIEKAALLKVRETMEGML
ncbi:MAG: RNA polymerase sporulation sigma factor SigK [Lachnospiraceae bacterium]|nr:RNA polymerase sporulation sigma factor SigK [Lachnospiraceae bacterium]